MERRRVLKRIGLTLFALVAWTAGPLSAQTGSLTGRVVDAGTMRPLEGAQVSLVRRSLGVLARADGRFLIPAVPVGTHTLEVRFIGYKTETRQVTVTAGQTVSVDIALSTQAISLDELVVTGTGVVTERRRLGATLASVSSDVMDKVAASNLTGALSGRVSGMLPEVPASVGSAAPIFLRGGVSITQRNAPLIYIDGVRIDNSYMHVGSTQQAGSLDRLNPNDVERVEIIKGAAAATLYGTEASAGVIQIITKRGTVSDPVWEFSTGFEGTKVPSARVKTSAGYSFTEKKIYDGGKPALDFIGNWGHAQEYNASVRGGSPRVRYFASGRVRDEKGTFDPEVQGVTDTNLRTGLNIQATDRLEIRLDFNTIRGNTRQPEGNFLANGSGYLWPIWLATPVDANAAYPYGGRYRSIYAVQWPPPNGYHGRLTEDELFKSSFTPPAVFGGSLNMDPVFGRKSRADSDRLTLSGAFTYDWGQGLKTEVIAGRDRIEDGYVEQGIKNLDSTQPDGFRYIYSRARTQTTLDFKTSWQHSFRPELSSTMLIGGQSFWEKKWIRDFGTRTFASPTLETLGGGSVLLPSTEQFAEVINAGVYAQEELALSNRLFLNAGVRLDGNSAFGENFGFGVYPKAGASWVVSEYGFWPFRTWNQLRLRAAVGAAGLQPGAFDATQTWIPDAALKNVSVVRPGNPGNPDLRPERSLETEVAAEMGFLGGRLGLELVYYQQKTTDALLPAPSASSLGFTQTRLTNLGQLKKHGVETSLNVTWIDVGETKFTTSLQTAWNKSEITDMGGLPCYRMPNSSGGVPGQRYHAICKGYAPGAWLGQVKDPKQPYKLGVPIEKLTRLTQITPNFLKNSVGGDSLEFKGNPTPAWTGSFSATLDLPGGVGMNALFTGGYDYYMIAQVQYIQDSGSRTSMRVAQMEAALDNPNTTVEERRRIADDFGNRHPSAVSDYYERADFFRFSNFSINYRVPQRLITWMRGMKKLDVQLSAANIYLWNRCAVWLCMADPLTPEHGDQDASSTGANQAFAQNIDYGNPPSPRRFGVHLRATF